MPEAKEDGSVVGADTSSKGACPEMVPKYVKLGMIGDRLCGRPIHRSLGGIDRRPVCLMHSRDPQKNQDEFQKEIDRILTEASAKKTVADFSRFIFPGMDLEFHSFFGFRSFHVDCDFEEATFTDKANFYNVSFEGASFKGVKFEEKATFTECHFGSRADFHGAIFIGEAAFGSQKETFDRTRFAGNADFGEARFAEEASFEGVEFEKASDFSKATFVQGTNFFRTEFTDDANFERARFGGETDFSNARFAGVANFGDDAEFAADTNFDGARFEREAKFKKARFVEDANFERARFGEEADFGNAKFAAANFSNVRFEQDANFSQAEFTVGSNFIGTTFTHNADFTGAKFAEDAIFSLATFKQEARFWGATFGKVAKFMGTAFLESVGFWETKFRKDSEMLPGPVFAGTKFSHPEPVQFYKTYLGQALFHYCDVSKFTFSSVEWRRRVRKRSWKTKVFGDLGGKRMVFDEIVDLKRNACGLGVGKNDPNELDHGLVAEIYQGLKKNYEEKRDYSTAGDFHYGEMEMRHRASLRKNHFRRGLHRHLGLVAWYKYASQYGESYLRPVLWLLAVMLFFACLYPVVGLQYQPSRDRAQTQSGGVNTSSVMSAQVRDPAVLTYSSPLRPGDNGHGSLLRARLRLWSHSLGASFFVSVFQRELVYDPVYPWGRVLAALEQALVSIFFALFILALRRQFRR